MPETLTESFCERCGTRYTFEAAAPKGKRLGKIKVLSKGFVNFVSNDDRSLDEAFAEARSDEQREQTTQQLDAFHQTFQFCMSCRQYTCANCWNEVESRCLSCAPQFGTDGLSFPAPVDPLARMGFGQPAPDLHAANGHGNGNAELAAAAEQAAEADVAAAADFAANSAWPTSDRAREDGPLALPAVAGQPTDTAAVEPASDATATDSGADADVPGMAAAEAAQATIGAQPEAVVAEALAADVGDGSAPPAGEVAEGSPIDASPAASNEVGAEPLVDDGVDEDVALAVAAAEVARQAAVEAKAERQRQAAAEADAERARRAEAKAELERQRLAAAEKARLEREIAAAADAAAEQELQDAEAKAAAERERQAAEAAAEIAAAQALQAAAEADSRANRKRLDDAEAQRERQAAVEAEAQRQRMAVEAELERERTAAAAAEAEQRAAAEAAEAEERAAAEAAEAEERAVAAAEAERQRQAETLAAAAALAATQPPAVRDDRVEAPTWQIVAPETAPTPEGDLLDVPPTVLSPQPAFPTPPTATNGAAQQATNGAGGTVNGAPPAGASQWPSPATTPPPQWPMPMAVTAPQWPVGQGTGRGANDDLWAASSKDVLTKSGSGVQSCTSCGLPLSASARFCRRCGTQQH